MLIPVENRSQFPPHNLALEEHVLRRFDPQNDYAVLWQNAPAVIVGRFQNTAEEVNQPYVEQEGVAVVRRLSGGGAVYHDLGNLCFTFVVRQANGRAGNFDYFTVPVVETLRRFGVKAERSSRNDLTIEGQKFSGNAQYVSGGRLLHHGTILFDSDLDAVARVLHVAKDKIESHGVKSVRSRVTNVRPYLKSDVALEEFAKVLMEEIGRQAGGIGPMHHLSDVDESQVDELITRRYGNWTWNWGDSPPFTLRAKRRFATGAVDVRLDAQGGIIRSARIFGDFLGLRDVGELEAALSSVPFDVAAVRSALSPLPVAEYLGGIGLEDVLGLLFDEVSDPATA
ncbi:MAG: lipoate--protein ligase [Thermaerobacter sp.]|nr:lipoate--protein ligase [Thermaerobacter sp.]